MKIARMTLRPFAALGLGALFAFAAVIVIFLLMGDALLRAENRYSAWRMRRVTASELNTRRVKP